MITFYGCWFDVRNTKVGRDFVRDMFAKQNFYGEIKFPVEIDMSVIYVCNLFLKDNDYTNVSIIKPDPDIHYETRLIFNDSMKIISENDSVGCTYLESAIQDAIYYEWRIKKSPERDSLHRAAEALGYDFSIDPRSYFHHH